MDRYLTPSQTQEFHLEIKRSRFITTVTHADSRQAAKDFIADMRARYPDARHHCWAFIVGAPNDFNGVDQSDDGEPKDTAGKPMLNVLQHSGLGHIAMVVSRYFGGIKLGAGGLVRAYSQSASQAVQALETREHLLRKAVTITLPYRLLSKVEYYLQTENIPIVDKHFNNGVSLTLGVALTQLAGLSTAFDALGYGEIVMVDDS